MVPAPLVTCAECPRGVDPQAGMTCSAHCAARLAYRAGMTALEALCRFGMQDRPEAEWLRSSVIETADLQLDRTTTDEIDAAILALPWQLEEEQR